jgi:hypothetical protein
VKEKWVVCWVTSMCLDYNFFFILVDFLWGLLDKMVFLLKNSLKVSTSLPKSFCCTCLLFEFW